MGALAPIIIAVAVPAIVSVLLLFAGWMIARRAPAGGLAWWSVPCAVGLGYTAGHLTLSGWPHFPPTDVTHWLPFIALAALALGLALQWKRHVAAVWTGRALLAAITCWLVLMPLIKSSAAAVAVPAIAALGAQLAWFWSGDVLSGRFRAWEYTLTLLILSVGISVALVLARSALLGQAGGALAAALGPLFLACLLMRNRGLELGSISWIVVPVLVGLLLVGNQFASLPKLPALMLAGAPVLMGAVAVVPRNTTPGTLRWGALVLAVALLLAAAFMITRELPPVEMSEF